MLACRRSNGSLYAEPLTTVRFGGDARILKRAGDLAVGGERAAHGQIALAGDEQHLVDRQVGDVRVGGGVVVAGEERAPVDLDGGAGEIGVHVVVDGVAGAGGGGGDVAEVLAFHLEAADAEIGVEVGDLELRAGGGGDDVAGDIAVQGEDAAEAGAVLHERLELRELHLIAGDVGADGAAAEVVQRVLIVGGGVDAGRAGDQRERWARRWPAGS